MQELLQEYGLTLAQVEATGGETDATPREKLTTDRRAMYAWQRSLMSTLAENNFCLHKIVKVRNAKALYSGGRGLTSRSHLLVGRRINVEATQLSYDYLVEACRRQGADLGMDPKETREWNLFLEGAVSRLTERLCEQRKEREAESIATVSTGNGTHREIVLSDVYGSEDDLNNDALNGFPAGTTAANNRKYKERQAAQRVEHDRLVAEGIPSDVAWYRAYGYGEHEAAVKATEWSRRRAGRGRKQSWTKADESYYRKINSASYKVGRRAGDDIGLNSQVGATATKKLGGSK